MSRDLWEAINYLIMPSMKMYDDAHQGTDIITYILQGFSLLVNNIQHINPFALESAVNGRKHCHHHKLIKISINIGQVELIKVTHPHKIHNHNL